jgi:hypothetical protein
MPDCEMPESSSGHHSKTGPHTCVPRPSSHGKGIFDHRQYAPLEEWQATVHMLHLKDVTSMVRIA